MIFASVVVLIDDLSEHENMLTLINDVINMSKHGTKKKSEYPTGIEPMTFRTPVGYSNH